MHLKFALCIFVPIVIFSTQQDIDIDMTRKNPIVADTYNCMEHEDTNTCPSVKMESGIYQCCKVSSTTFSLSRSICSLWMIQEVTDEQIKDIEESIKEIYAFIGAYSGYGMPSMTVNYNCAQKSFNIKYEKGTYSENEMSIIKDENYCLRLYYDGLYDLGFSLEFTNKKRTISKEDCKNAKTLPNSKNTCAYASFNFILDDNTNQKISTCLYISKLSLETQNLDNYMKSQFDNLATATFGDGANVDSFEVDILDKDGKSFKYDSETGVIIQSSDVNKSENLKKSTLLLFGLLFLLL